VTDNSGGVLEHRHYDPFGTLYAGTITQTNFGFTGELFEGAIMLAIFFV